ncbi:histidine kinase [Nocardiopsis dassonvillei]|uniref:sensor histidine kinase n=1 Tax=Nocardiopsis dassonvillei TaxID=2014 RepID=UPI003F558B0C
MRRPSPLPDLSRWVSLSGNRPPRVVSLLFWGSVLTTLAIYAVMMTGLVPTGGAETDDPVTLSLVATGLGSLVACAVLWPFLAWSPHSPRSRTTASGIFMVVTLTSFVTSNHTLFLLLCVGTVNAVIVFGVPGGIVYGALVVGFSLLLPLLVPGAPFMAGVLMAVSLLFIVVASGLASVGLLVSARRAGHTRELLEELERTHGELGAAHGELEAAHAELRRSTDRIRELTVSEERARMSREMHDSTGHHLTALSLCLANALRFREAGRTEEAWEEVGQARALAGDALTDTRRWVRALRPLALEGRAGARAMRSLAESFQGGGVRIGFEQRGGEWPELPEEAELVCYRAVQEGLTNAMRHSGGDAVLVEVEVGAEAVAVTVADNGGGAPEGAVRGGFGLRGLAERVEGVGGELVAENAAEGFRLRVEVPVGMRVEGPVERPGGGGGEESRGAGRGDRGAGGAVGTDGSGGAADTGDAEGAGGADRPEDAHDTGRAADTHRARETGRAADTDAARGTGGTVDTDAARGTGGTVDTGEHRSDRPEDAHDTGRAADTDGARGTGAAGSASGAGNRVSTGPKDEVKHPAGAGGPEGASAGASASAGAPGGTGRSGNRAGTGGRGVS